MNNEYGYYSRKLNKPFDTLDQLRAAEIADQKAKDEKMQAAKAKKDAAIAVEDAYKALNAAKKLYKDELSDAISRYTDAMKILELEFAKEKDAISAKLMSAETNYKAKLKEFTDKHPEGFHITLKDGDYETTISQQGSPKTKTSGDVYADWIQKIFQQVFNEK